MDNIRMIIEDALLEGFAGASAVLNTLSERTAFIMAIHPKDQLRLLTMVSQLAPSPQPTHTLSSLPGHGLGSCIS